MTATYERRLVWIVDGLFDTRRRAKSQSRNRELDRRKKRRQHARATRDALTEYHAQLEDDFHEQQRLYYDAGSYDDYPDYDYDYYLDFVGAGDDHERHSLDYDDYDDWDPDADYCGVDYWGDAPVRVEDTVRVTQEDVGKSLGEILEEYQARQRQSAPLNLGGY